MKFTLLVVLFIVSLCCFLLSSPSSSSSSSHNPSVVDISDDLTLSQSARGSVSQSTPSPPITNMTESPHPFNIDKVRNERIRTNVLKDAQQRNWNVLDQIRAAVILVAKGESHYIAHFVKYHIALGFDTIFIYDNEDEPTYEKILVDNKIHPKYFVLHHIPGNTVARPQILGIHHFEIFHMQNYTHATHFDGDEYITLRKHHNIKELIRDYFVGNVAALSMNWKYFGSSGRKAYEDIPYPVRFTRCQHGVDHHVKSIFQTDRVEKGTINAHYVIPKEGFCEIDSSFKAEGLPLWSNLRRPADVIHLNHYKSKTFEEFVWSTARGRADAFKNDPTRVIVKDRQRGRWFKHYDRNEEEDLVTHDFYVKHVEKRDFSK